MASDSYLEMQNECPCETKDELRVAIDDLICSNVDQFDFSLFLEEIKSILNILEFVEPHFAFLTGLSQMEREDKRQ